MQLDDRSRRILFAVIQSYINQADPVGSRYIKRKYSIDFSPATIRNIMSDLEEMGLLFQPHTSAGRIPTDIGYRVFVDALNSEGQVSVEDLLSQTLMHQMESLHRDIKLFLDNASRMLSDFTHCIGITMTPSTDASVLRRIEFLPYRKNQIAVILVTDSGMIRHRLVTVDRDYTPSELARIADYLNSRFEGMMVDEIRKNVSVEIAREGMLCDGLISNASSVFKSIFQYDPGDVFVSGLADVLRLPDFGDMERIRHLLRTLEDKSLIVKLLDRIGDTEGTQIFIGSENSLAEMKNFSLIAAPYREGGRTAGAIGIIGPTRMDYRQAIAIVGATARYISEMLAYRD